MKATRCRPSSLLPLISGVCLVSALAQQAPQEGWNPDTPFPTLTPAEQIKTIEVPKGYKLECVASEPMVEEPTNFAFDGNGAMYVCEFRTYMQDEFATDQLKPDSRVVKLVDTNGDGVMDKRTVFIDGVILPRMVLPLQDRVLVNFSNSTAVWAYFDDNKDGVSDRREAAYVGRNTGGNVEHQGSGMLWNLDNTICTNDFRFTYKDGKLTEGRHSMERISQWGLARDDDGRLFGSSAGGGNPIHGFQLPAGYPVLRVNDHAPGYNNVFSACKVWDQSGGGYNFKEQRVLNEHSASAGQSIMRTPLMPEWYGMHVVCEPVGRFIRMSRIDWKDGLGVADNQFPKSEFIRSTHAYFRPVWTATAPNGSFMFSDMYRGIIQEKAWFPTDPNDARQDWVARYHRVKKWDMIKVVRHGRIFRMVPESGKLGPQPKMLDETSTQLVAHLANPNGWWRDTAQMLIVTRGDKSAVPALLAMANKHEDPSARINAMWSLQGLDSLPKETILANLGHAHPRVRRAAVQLAEPWFVKKDSEIGKKLASMLGDDDAQVRTQIYLAYSAAAIPAPAELTAKPAPVIAALQQAEKAVGLMAALNESGKQGQKIYETLCTSCHGPDGKGVKAGEGLLAPPLNRSEWFNNNGHLEVIAGIILKGQTGPINGKTYGEGMMLTLEDTYNDEQVAAVINYVGQRWNEWKVPATTEDIAAIRKKLAERKTPFTFDELKKIPRPKR
jgi:mono/diheme cytochrome c family protein